MLEPRRRHRTNINVATGYRTQGSLDSGLFRNQRWMSRLVFLEREWASRTDVPATTTPSSRGIEIVCCQKLLGSSPLTKPVLFCRSTDIGLICSGVAIRLISNRCHRQWPPFHSHILSQSAFGPTTLNLKQSSPFPQILTIYTMPLYFSFFFFLRIPQVPNAFCVKPHCSSLPSFSTTFPFPFTRVRTPILPYSFKKRISSGRCLPFLGILNVLLNIASSPL